MKKLLNLFNVLFLFSSIALGQEDGTVKKQKSFSKNNLALSALAGIGDLNSDGNPDLIYGEPKRFDQKVIVNFLDSAGNVISKSVISSNRNGFDYSLGGGELFGKAITNLGDVNQDGIADIAIGAPRENSRRGEVFVLFMSRDGKVKDFKKLSKSFSNFNGIINQDDNFGWSLGTLKDWNNNGVNELLVGSPSRKENGGVWILNLDKNGQIISKKEFNENSKNLKKFNFNGFGESIAGTSDLNSNGFPELIVGDWKYEEGGNDNGAIFSIILKENNGIKISSVQKINNVTGNLNDTIPNSALFGISLSNMGDLNGDSVPDIAVGASGEEYSSNSKANLFTGKVRIIFLEKNGSVKNYQAIGNNFGRFKDTLKTDDEFGKTLTNIGDLNGDSIPELVVGAPGKETVYILFLNGVPQLPDDDDKDTTSGLQPHQPFKRLSTYPNPVAQSQNLTLTLPAGVPEGKQGRVTLFDMEGQLVRRKHFTYQGQQEIPLKLRELAPGSYQLYLKTGEFQGFSKVIVE